MRQTEYVRSERDVRGYKIMGILATLVVFLGPPVLVVLTFIGGSMAGASMSSLLIACVIALAVSLVISYFARQFGRTANAIVYKAKYGEEPPWNR